MMPTVCADGSITWKRQGSKAPIFVQKPCYGTGMEIQGRMTCAPHHSKKCGVVEKIGKHKDRGSYITIGQR